MLTSSEFEAEVITHYTTEEGGRWIPWPIQLCPPSMAQIERASLKQTHHIWSLATKRGKGYRGITIHAMKTSTGREWDSYNGWRL